MSLYFNSEIGRHEIFNWLAIQTWNAPKLFVLENQIILFIYKNLADFRISYVLFELLVSFELSEIMILCGTLVTYKWLWIRSWSTTFPSYPELLSDYCGYYNCVKVYAWNIKSTVFDESSSLLPSFLIREHF